MKKKISIGMGIVLIIIVAIGIVLFLVKKETERCAQIEAFVFVEKNSTNYKEEWFITKWGVTADILQIPYRNSKRFTRIFKKKMDSYERATTVFVEIPSEFSEIDKFEEIINNHPETTFYVYCTIEPLKYWSELEPDERKIKETEYNTTYKELKKHENIVLFEFYNIEWLLKNEGNYLKDGSLNADATCYLFTSFATHTNLFEKEKFLFSENSFSFINEYRNKLEGKTAVVFGDSIWDINRTSLGVETLVSKLSGLEIVNLAVGGACASILENNHQNFVKEVNDSILDIEIEHPTYIFIEYGLNDYFSQAKIENEKDLFDENTYKGALRKGIELLKERFSEAEIILVGPSTIMIYDYGKQNISGEGSLIDYENAMSEVAKDYDLMMMYNYNVGNLKYKNIETFIKLDKCHLNENGMYIYGRRILSYLCDK